LNNHLGSVEEALSELLDDIRKSIIEGNRDHVELGVQRALADGHEAREIMFDVLVAAMAEVGELYENGEFYVPEMMISARAMKAGLEILRPMMVESGVKPLAHVVLGTVEGDLHDIGKNLVGMMLQGAGFEVIDLGVDVSSKTFIEAIDKDVQILGMSGLLTTTIPIMETVISDMSKAGLRDKVLVIVGGAPVTEEFSVSIGADGYAADASKAVAVARELLHLE